MAFFGLTALGAQSPFDAVIGLDAFNEHELRTAYNTVSKKSGLTDLTSGHMSEVMTALYRGPAPPIEVEAVEEAASSHVAQGVDDIVTMDVFLKLISSLQESSAERIEQQRKEAARYRSNEEYRKEVLRHGRNDKDPREKYLTPQTQAHQIGWQKPRSCDMPDIRPKNSCEETKYAAELVKSGAFY